MKELQLRLPMWIMVFAEDLQLHSDEYNTHAFKMDIFKQSEDLQELMKAFVNGDKELEEFIYKIFNNEIMLHTLKMKTFKEGDEHYEMIKRISDRRDEILKASDNEDLDNPKRFKKSKSKSEIDPKFLKPKQYATSIKAREVVLAEQEENDADTRRALDKIKSNKELMILEGVTDKQKQAINAMTGVDIFPYRGKLINTHNVGKVCSMLVSFTDALDDLLSGECKLIVKEGNKKAFFITDNDELAEINLYEKRQEASKEGFKEGELIDFTYDPLIRKIELARFYKGLEEELYYGTNNTEILDNLTYKTVNELGLIMGSNNDWHK